MTSVIETHAPSRARRRTALSALAITMALAAAVPATASAATRYVDDTGGADAGNCTSAGSPCLTPQYAHDQSADGDRIFVAPGDYTSVTVTKSVRLRGAQATVDGRDRTVVAAEESKIARINLNSGTAVVDGFLIESVGDIGVLMINGSDHVVENNVIRNHHHGISDQGPGGASWTARHNRFENNGGGPPSPAGVWAFGSEANLVEENTFVANRNGGDGVAINANGGDGLTVRGNTSNDDVNFVVSTDGENTTIEDNVVTGHRGTGIFLARGSVNVDIVGNSLSTTVTGLSGISFSAAFGGPETRGASIIGNTVSGANRGVNVQANTYRGVVEIHLNRFVNNSDAGVRNNLAAASGSVDAENNWWGCNAGPNQTGCTKVDGTGTTDFDPWLTLGVTASPASILTGGDTSTVAAGFSRNSAGTAVDTDEAFVAPIGLATSLGTLDSSAPTTVGGVALAELTSGATAGTATITATLDNGSATDTVAFTANAGPAGADGSDGTNGTNGTPGQQGQPGPAGTPGQQGLPGQNTPTAEEEPAPVAIAAGTLRASSKGVVKIKVSCPAGAGICEGVVTLKSGRKTLGRKAFRVAGGRTVTVPVKLVKSGLASLKAGKLKKLSVVAFSRDGDGDATETKRTLNVKR